MLLFASLFCRWTRNQYSFGNRYLNQVQVTPYDLTQRHIQNTDEIETFKAYQWLILMDWWGSRNFHVCRWAMPHSYDKVIGAIWNVPKKLERYAITLAIMSNQFLFLFLMGSQNWGAGLLNSLNYESVSNLGEGGGYVQRNWFAENLGFSYAIKSR